MMINNFRSLLLASGIVFCVVGTTAEAATCPTSLPLPTTHYIGATTNGASDTASCLYYSNGGDSNGVNGNNDTINNLPAGSPYFGPYVTLDKTDWNFAAEAAHSTANALSFTFTNTPGQEQGVGTWSISSALVAGYKDFVLALKTGDNDPDWAAFALGANFLSGTWIIWQGTQPKGLSHMTLYGKACDGVCPVDANAVVPIPAALPLLLSGLGGLAWLGRLRRRNVATAS